MTKLLSGLELAPFIKERQLHQVRGLIQHFKVQPRLAIIQVVNNPVTSLYINIKKNYGNDIKVVVDVIKIDQVKVANLIKQLNSDNKITGIIVQLPLTDTSETDSLVNLIDPKKDVDGLGINSLWDSATATAINWLFAGYNIDLVGKSIAIVGKGRLVGKPLEKMWRNSGLEVSSYDDKVSDLKKELFSKDIIVSATGQPRLIKSDMIKSGAIVIDVGAATDRGKVVGDLDDEVRVRQDLTLTPLKGGVGPLTVAALMDNVIRAAYKSIK